ncbi:hypothetical protein TNCV_4773991 [Trichonephila clavipes]|nr:hypothetical protein TNCV_4773991 [Trichonephila clavipes]
MERQCAWVPFHRGARSGGGVRPAFIGTRTFPRWMGGLSQRERPTLLNRWHYWGLSAFDVRGRALLGVQAERGTGCFTMTRNRSQFG